MSGARGRAEAAVAAAETEMTGFEAEVVTVPERDRVVVAAGLEAPSLPAAFPARARASSWKMITC